MGRRHAVRVVWGSVCAADFREKGVQGLFDPEMHKVAVGLDGCKDSVDGIGLGAQAIAAAHTVTVPVLLEDRLDRGTLPQLAA